MDSTTKTYFVTPDETQLFMFSAITWNRHQIHFNRNQAHAEGFPNVVVHRGLLGNFLARALTEWTGNGQSIQKLSWKVQKSTFPGVELKIMGKFQNDTQQARHINQCELTIENPSGECIATGIAILNKEK